MSEIKPGDIVQLMPTARHYGIIGPDWVEYVRLDSKGRLIRGGTGPATMKYRAIKGAQERLDVALIRRHIRRRSIKATLQTIDEEIGHLRAVHVLLRGEGTP